MIAMGFNLQKLPRFRTAQNISDIPLQALEPDELYYDYASSSYRTKSAEAQIRLLQEQLKNKEVKRKKDLQHIISYYYKR